MSYRYKFFPEAEEELWEATIRYARIRPRLGEAFFDEVIRTIDRILESPKAWPKHGRLTRICCTRRFKYGVVYQLDADEVRIVAVMHLHRKPGYWKRRLKKKK